MRLRRVVVALAGALVAAALAGCTTASRPPAPLGNGLQFTAQRASSWETHTVGVRVTLRNVSSETVTWPAIRFGVLATPLSKVASNTPSMTSVNIGQPYGKSRDMPLALRSGQATTSVWALPLERGTWRVAGVYIAPGGPPRGDQSAPFVVVVR